MNRHYQNIRTPPHSFLVLCYLVIFLLASCCVGNSSDVYFKNITCIDQERDALLKFKQHIQSDNCGLMTSWGNPNKPDCCTWKGVSCSNLSGHVVGLRLSGNTDDKQWGCLDSPTFSPSLGELKHLKYLDLSYNNFNAMVIPSFIGSLINLIHLNLANSEFSGNIPHQLGNLTRLTSLDLSNNFWFSPKSLNWLSQLTLLRDINLSGTDISKAQDWFSIIGSLPLLEVLNMDDCQLSIPPSSSSFFHSANLRVISLSGNGFNSFSSFQWLFNTSNNSSVQRSLKYLDLSNNFLQRLIPNAIGNLKFLTKLDLSQNLLTSITPDVLGNLEFLTYLDLSKNTLTSISPDAISNLKSLRHMDLSYNSLSGTIPDAIWNLEFLTHLDLSRNSLSSTIPDSIGNLKFLTYLALSMNSLSSIIPDAIANLQSLTHMDLSYNSLSGLIPSSLGGASSISYLDLSNNKLEGTIPGSIANLEYLGYLDLSRNNLSGDIPCKLKMREYPLYASFAFNNLSGSIPKHLSYLGPDPFQGNPSFHTDKIQGSCDKIYHGLYVSIGLGICTGFWTVCGILTVKSSWRHAYLRFLDPITNRIYVIVARLRRHCIVCNMYEA